ncbi:MAG: hypothetical protein JSS53_00210 [Proteobacteria bacterium]|nr:hypothetical protein [Pseudomonadota bacterium]
MKNSTKRVTTLLLGLCLSSLVSVADAKWHSCLVANEKAVGSGDYVCCNAAVSADPSVLNVSRGSEPRVICMAKNNKAWHWVYVGYEAGCFRRYGSSIVTPYDSYAWRCEQQ